VRQFFPLTFPCVLGRDFSGVVTAAGADVQGLAVGDEVFGVADAKRGGTHADFVAADGDAVAKKPRGLSHVDAASLPLAGLTAMIALDEVAQLRGGQRVLIHAAAGGVGGLAVQLAKHRGCWVAGTCRAANADYVKRLGADRVIDYASEDFTSVLRDLDVVFDTLGGEVNRRSATVLRAGGCLVQITAAPVPPGQARADIEVKPAVIRPRRDLLERLADLAARGVLKPQVESVLPLSEAASGYEQSRTGHQRGKIVLRVA
jgi:NADPH:quinone reductase-like Zn-dependent oxidoreductase